MAAIGATQLIIGCLTPFENQVDKVQIIHKANFIKVGKQRLDRIMTGVIYAPSQ